MAGWAGLFARAATRADPSDEAGLVARLLRPLFRFVAKSWHMYPIGVLFGLGFDTATETGLLAIGGIEALGLLADKLLLSGPLRDALDAICALIVLHMFHSRNKTPSRTLHDAKCAWRALCATGVSGRWHGYRS